MAIHNMWYVGGAVRDEIMGIDTKDVDIVVECDDFDELVAHIDSTHSRIIMVKPEFLTIRALDKLGKPRDYVMARKESNYTDGRHPDVVEPGTILEDLGRRDFTANAIAKNVRTGELLDPFNGIQHIQARELHCVGNAGERFAEDGIRILRALRFFITRGLVADQEILNFWAHPSGAQYLENISTERITEELKKCFAANTYATLRMLTMFAPEYLMTLFKEDNIWLLPTTKLR
jgi:tRNA nucleotidyltransferase (CCA-adding enzyme)